MNCKRISWGAILAGAVLALVAQLAFSLLGLGLGASAFNPYDDNPTGGLGPGAALWTLLSVLLSLFTGGYVAGRLAGMPRAQDSMLHGLVTFGLTSLLGFYLLTSGVGRVLGGAGSLVSSVVSSAGRAASNSALGLVDAAKDKLQDSGFDVSDIQAQVDQLLRRQQPPPPSRSEPPSGAPSARPSDAATATAPTQVGPPAPVAVGPGAATGASGGGGDDIKELVTRVFSRLPLQNRDAALEPADREALINVLGARLGKSRAEAEAIVAGLQQTYAQTRAKTQQVKAETIAAAEAARQAARRGALAASLALLLGALAAAYGARLAARHHDSDTVAGHLTPKPAPAGTDSSDLATTGPPRPTSG